MENERKLEDNSYLLDSSVNFDRRDSRRCIREICNS